ncbi:uncharacterized protein LOC143850840 isoform X3 [Tasmannia lanceolata]|uniref:uncharacterized protein LOC143850840 isoform X3 n=1 Tax=Tasmannia lanceolata TaxID=3420 RepID=UPI004063991A
MIQIKVSEEEEAVDVVDSAAEEEVEANSVVIKEIKVEINLSSGRLQLVDATGSIDVVIPDLLSDGVTNNIYEEWQYQGKWRWNVSHADGNTQVSFQPDTQVSFQPEYVLLDMRIYISLRKQQYS